MFCQRNQIFVGIWFEIQHVFKPTKENIKIVNDNQLAYNFYEIKLVRIT